MPPIPTSPSPSRSPSPEPSAPARSPTASGLSAALRFDHERLLSNTRHVLSSLVCGESGVVPWSHVRQELLAHLEAEELFLLPTADEAVPAVTEGVRRDHAHLRELMNRISAALADRAPDAAALLEELVKAQARHAESEERDFYPWAEYGVGETESKSALRHIEAAGIDRKHQESLP